MLYDAFLYTTYIIPHTTLELTDATRQGAMEVLMMLETEVSAEVAKKNSL